MNRIPFPSNSFYVRTPTDVLASLVEEKLKEFGFRYIRLPIGVACCTAHASERGIFRLWNSISYGSLENFKSWGFEEVSIADLFLMFQKTSLVYTEILPFAVRVHDDKVDLLSLTDVPLADFKLLVRRIQNCYGPLDFMGVEILTCRKGWKVRGSVPLVTWPDWDRFLDRLRQDEVLTLEEIAHE